MVYFVGGLLNIGWDTPFSYSLWYPLALNFEFLFDFVLKMVQLNFKFMCLGVNV